MKVGEAHEIDGELHYIESVVRNQTDEGVDRHFLEPFGIVEHEGKCLAEVHCTSPVTQMWEPEQSIWAVLERASGGSARESSARRGRKLWANEKAPLESRWRHNLYRCVPPRVSNGRRFSTSLLAVLLLQTRTPPQVRRSSAVPASVPGLSTRMSVRLGSSALPNKTSWTEDLFAVHSGLSTSLFADAMTKPARSQECAEPSVILTTTVQRGSALPMQLMLGGTSAHLLILLTALILFLLAKPPRIGVRDECGYRCKGERGVGSRCG